MEHIKCEFNKEKPQKTSLHLKEYLVMKFTLPVLKKETQSKQLQT